MDAYDCVSRIRKADHIEFIVSWRRYGGSRDPIWQSTLAVPANEVSQKKLNPQPYAQAPGGARRATMCVGRMWKLIWSRLHPDPSAIVHFCSTTGLVQNNLCAWPESDATSRRGLLKRGEFGVVREGDGTRGRPICMIASGSHSWRCSVSWLYSVHSRSSHDASQAWNYMCLCGNTNVVCL